MPSKFDKKKQSPTQAAGNGWLRRHWNLAAIGAIMVALPAAIFWWRAGEAPTTSPASSGDPSNTRAGTAGSSQAASGAENALLGSQPAQRAEQLRTLTSQYEVAEHTLCEYRASTKYPHESRPISEHPDQVYPNRPVEDSHAMRTPDGKGNSKVLIKTSQSHVYVASGESVSLFLKATDSEGKTLPLFITRSVAHGMTFKDARNAPQFALAFGDGGNNGDVVAGDGTYSTIFTPANTSLATFNGTIQIEVNYSVGDQPGVVRFDLVYTPELPAVWSGPIRDAHEDGGLNFYLKANVSRPGRYIVNGRVDDASGKPFALVTFNDILNQGQQEIKLPVFGKLLHDQNPPFPLTLRDVDAYLLLENADPDRALMPRLVGSAFVTKTNVTKGFSDSEWQSEERTRYLTEFGKDTEQAKNALISFDPTLADKPLPRQACSSDPKPGQK